MPDLEPDDAEGPLAKDQEYQDAVRAAIEEAVDHEQNERFWLRTLTLIVEAYWRLDKQDEDGHEDEAWRGKAAAPAPEVQRALDRMVVGAANLIAAMVEQRLPQPAQPRRKGRA